MDTVSLRAAVRAITTISDEEMATFEASLVEQQLARGERFVEAGRVCSSIGFVAEGALRAYYLHGGEEAHLEFFFERSFVTSYRSFLTRSPSRLYVEAVEDCRLLVFSYETVQGGYARSAEWERFGRLVCERIFTSAQERIERLLLDSPQERYLRLLAEQPLVFDRIPLWQIASYLGIAPPSLSRIRRRLATKGSPQRSRRTS